MDSYCPLAWVSLNILPDYITPCCQWKGKCINTSDVTLVDQNLIDKGFEQIRKDMIDGKYISGCEQCYYAEQAGAKSPRQDAIEKYGRIQTVELKNLDINFDNVCNLKCRGCASTSSHLWANDEIKIYGKTFSEKKYADQSLDINIDGLERISISGGEPFLSKKFDSFAERILHSPSINDVEIVIDTNATVIPSKNVQDLIIKSQKVFLSVSMDGIYELQEYYRSGSNFDTCIKNIKFLIDLLDKRKDGSKLNIHTTVNIYNVNRLQEIKNYFLSNFSNITYRHRILYWPEHMSIRNLPKDLKQTLIDIVKTFDTSFKDVLYELENQGEDYFSHFVNFHNILDQSRNETLKVANPLIYNYINQYKTSIKDSRAFFLTQMDIIK